MAIKRRLGVVGAILLFTLGAASCGSDDDPPASGGRGGTGGKGGAAAKGGTSGTGGTAGKGGTGGTTGAGGTAGKGGSGGTVGAGGSSGAMGTAGAVGTAGTDAGPDARPDGAGGTAGADAAPDTGTAGSDASADGSDGAVMCDDKDCAQIVINEIESNPSPDWVEFFNAGTNPVNISGWMWVDSDGLPDAATAADGAALPRPYRFPAGTILQPGAYITPTEGIEFNFGLGGGDSVLFYDSDGDLVQSHTWTAHAAAGTYARCPNGTGAFVDVAATKGASNATSCPD